MGTREHERRPTYQSLLASSRLACQDIQRIQHNSTGTGKLKIWLVLTYLHIQPYSHTRHTSYSALQPASVRTMTVQSGAAAGVEAD